MRIRREAQLIETSDFNMSQISYMVGINGSRYFSRCFKTNVRGFHQLNIKMLKKKPDKYGFPHSLYQNVCDISFTFTFSIFEFKKASYPKTGFVFTTMSLNWKPDRIILLIISWASINLCHSRCKSRKVIPGPI